MGLLFCSYAMKNAEFKPRHILMEAQVKSLKQTKFKEKPAWNQEVLTLKEKAGKMIVSLENFSIF